MATRVIENHRDRLTTILIAPLMSCSARLPVYFVLTAAFVPAVPLFGWLPLQGVTLFCMYLVGLVAAAAVAWLLKRTLLKGPTPPFVMELPSYKWPSPKLVLLRMWERGWAFIERAGTLILAVSIVVWALGYFPHDQAAVEGPFLAERERLEAAIETADSDADRELLEGRLTEIDNQIDAEYLRQSWLGRAGRVIEPVVRPLGWDWRIGAAAIASFPAREVVMGVLGVIYNLGAELDVGESADQTRLASRLQAATHDDTGKPVYNLPVALGIMVFFALCAQCAATLAVIKRETNSWFWPAFTFGYMTALAYVGALVTYQVGMWLAG
jgi:ferrous iron transport protein B